MARPAAHHLGARALLAAATGLGACDPYAAWPAPTQVYPWVYTPETDLAAYETVRWESETWDPQTDATEAGLYLMKSANHRLGAPRESLAHFEAMRGQLPPPGDGVRLSLVGDAMWIGDNHDAFAEDVAHLLDGDLRVGNLETPTSPDHPTALTALGLYAFNAPPALLDGLPLDLVQVNNNHSVDAGDEGLQATLAELAQRGVTHTGVDAHAIREVAGRRIAFLGYTWGINQRGVTSAHDLHIVPFGHLDPDLDLDGVADDIASARADGAQSIVLLLHWGFEYEYYPDPYLMQIGRRLVALGADLVVGSGPHVAQPAERCAVNRPEVAPGVGTCSVRTEDGIPRTAAILYSLGNFQSVMPTTPCKVGLIATATLGDGGVSGLSWLPVANVADPAHRLVPLEALDDARWVDESARLDAHLGANWRRSENE